MRIIFIFFLGGSILFQGCGEDVTFEQKDTSLDSSSASIPFSDQDGTNDGQGTGVDVNEGGENPTYNDVVDKCNGVTEKSTINIDFPAPQRTCDWGQGGNLAQLNGFFQARIEQERNLNLPAGAVICDAKFDFARQNFLYDDHFLLLFNDSLIASSYDFSQQLSSGSFGLLQYNWTDIAGINWDNNKETIFCPSIDGSQSSCSFPGHDQQGFIELEYDDSFIKAIMANGVPENHSFSLVSVGDNDNLDCEHSDVEFSVEVTFAR